MLAVEPLAVAFCFGFTLGSLLVLDVATLVWLFTQIPRPKRKEAPMED